MSYLEIINKISEDLALPPEVVKKAYESYWFLIRQSIKTLPFKLLISEEEFNKLRTNFNIPSLGKLSCTYDRMLGVNKRYEEWKSGKKDLLKSIDS